MHPWSRRNQKTGKVRAPYEDRDQSFEPYRLDSCDQLAGEISRALPRGDHWLPEHELLLYLILGAIQGALSGDKEDMDWIFVDEDIYPGSFFWACEHLDISPEATRTAISNNFERLRGLRKAYYVKETVMHKPRSGKK